MAYKVNKNKKKDAPKVFDKTMILCTAIIISITVIIVCAVVLPDPIFAAVKLNGAQKFIDAPTIEKVCVVAPLEKEGVFEDKSFVISDSEAKETAAKLDEILENSKYSKTYVISETGIWKPYIVTYNADAEYKIYIDQSSLYIESQGKLIRYIPTNDYAETYDEFYNKIIEKLDKTEK